MPIALLLLFLAPRALNESSAAKGRLDVPGAVTVTAAMVSLVYGLSNTSSHGWTATLTLAPIAVSVVLLVVFAVIETRAPRPLMPLRILANRNRAGSYAMMLCVATSAFCMLFFLTQYMQNVLGWSPIMTGAGFVPLTVGIVLSAGVTSRILGRISVRVPLLVGPVLVFAGLAGMSRLTVTSSYLDILAPLVVMSLGLGMQFVSLTLTAVQGVAPAETGLASALLNTMQQLGGALGLSVLATVAIDATKTKAHTLTAGHTHGAALTHLIATADGYTTAFEVAAGIALAGLIVSVAVLRLPRTATPSPLIVGDSDLEFVPAV